MIIKEIHPIDFVCPQCKADVGQRCTGARLNAHAKRWDLCIAALREDHLKLVCYFERETPLLHPIARAAVWDSAKANGYRAALPLLEDMRELL